MNTSDSCEFGVFWNQSLSEELQRFLATRLKCPEIAADLTHETYLRLDRKFRESPHDNARALAFRIALNLAIDYQRKAEVRNRYTTEEDLDSVLATTPDRNVSLDQALIAEEQLAAVRQAMAELPVDCRTAFHLHSVEGMSYSQIAKRMNVSKSMVNKLMAQAMLHCAAKVNR